MYNGGLKMARILLREKVISMRSDGASLTEIGEKLPIPKSTIRYWCRNIILSNEQQKRLFTKQKLAGLYAAERIRKKRIELTKQLFNTGIKEIGKISGRELFLIGTALYWAEGYRKGDGEFGFTNSDPKMIKVIIRWLEEQCEINRDRVHLRLCINAIHKKRVKEINDFWSRATRIPLSQFSKPTLINCKNTKIYNESSNYFGTLRIKVYKSTNLKRKVMGWIEGVILNSVN